MTWHTCHAAQDIFTIDLNIFTSYIAHETDIGWNIASMYDHSLSKLELKLSKIQ